MAALMALAAAYVTGSFIEASYMERLSRDNHAGKLSSEIGLVLSDAKTAKALAGQQVVRRVPET